MVRKIFCLFAVLAIAGTAGADLLAYYDFSDAGANPTSENEGTAGTAADGVLMNGATIVDIDPDARGVDHVLVLDYGDGTVNQYMDIGKDWADWDATGLEPFSIAAWIYITPGTRGWRTLMSKGWGASWDISMGTPYGAGDHDIAFSAAPAVGGTSPITSGVLCEGDWHHVVGVVVGYGPTAAELYVNGVLQGTAPVWEGVDANDANVLIGADPIKLAEGYDYSWNGMLDNVAIYNNVLTAQQVSDIYAGTSPWPWFFRPPVWLEITGPAEVTEGSQAQYSAIIWSISDVNVTEEVIWWVEPETFASIDANGLLTVENLDTSANITIHAQYYTANCVDVEAEMVVLCIPVEYHVDGVNGNDANDGLSWETAFATIQKGIDTAFDGDTVLVADGVYTGEGNRDIDFGGKAITVRSIDPNDPDIVAATIIDCNGTEEEPHRGFYFHNDEGPNSVLDGFTITNGYDPDFGGGIKAWNSSPTIRNCTITGNSGGTFGGSGGGVYSFNSSLKISNCKITGNSAPWGAGITCSGDGSPIISYCTITGNSTFSVDPYMLPSGGGICARAGGLKISNCTISDNSAQAWGGGIYCDDNCTISNCTISGNSAQWGGGIHCEHSSPKVTNCILWGDTPSEIYVSSGTPVVTYSDVQGGYTGIGNIDIDPNFADPNNGDYHLLSERGRYWPAIDVWVLDEVSSPCIDGGDPNVSPSGERTPNGGRINMGAFGNTGYASMSEWPRAGDINRDGIVNFKDYAALADDWLETLPWAARPQISITNPSEGALIGYNAIDPISVEAAASGPVVKVEFFANGIKIGQDNNGLDGWDIGWHPESEGSFALTATATTQVGVKATSTAVNVTVAYVW